MPNALLIPALCRLGSVAALLLAETMSVVMLAIARQRLELGRNPLLPLLAPALLCSTAVAPGVALLPAGTEHYWWLEVVGGGALLGGCLLVFERRSARAAWILPGRAS